MITEDEKKRLRDLTEKIISVIEKRDERYSLNGFFGQMMGSLEEDELEDCGFEWEDQIQSSLIYYIT